MTDQIKLREQIEAAWGLATSFTPEKWTFDNPAIGQCGVTALYVQSREGGEIWEGWLDEWQGKRHFFNVIQWDLVDYTWRQFPAATKLYHPKPITRNDILANPWFVERYENFLNNLKQGK